jgi:hypothetical protein
MASVPSRSYFSFSFVINHRSWFNFNGSGHRNNILIYIQQDATLHSLFYLETILHISGSTTTHHQERKQLYLQPLVFVTPLMLSAAIVKESEPLWVCCGWRTLHSLFYLETALHVSGGTTTFRVVPPPIIRSANNCIYSIWYLSHTANAICRYRGRVWTALSVLWLAYVTQFFSSGDCSTCFGW